MASRLVCSNRGIIVFAVVFLFYFFTTYDLISVSVRYDDELHLSAANDAVGSTPMTTVTAINSSFDLLFGNESCQGDLFRKRGGYRSTPVRHSDSEFPIAFKILVHWYLEQFEILMSAIYRPRNVYCIHIDAKTSWTFQSAVDTIAHCLRCNDTSACRVCRHQ